MSRSRAEDNSIIGHRSARPDQNNAAGGLYSHPNRRHFRAPDSAHVSLATPVVRGVKSSELELDDVLVPPFEYGEAAAMQTRDIDESRQGSVQKIIAVSRRQSQVQASEAGGDAQKRPPQSAIKHQQPQMQQPPQNVVQRNARLSLTGDQAKDVTDGLKGAAT